jgi:hypothetical protein
VVDTTDKTTSAVLREVSEAAIERAVLNGAIRDTVNVAEMEAIPLAVRQQYS